MHHPILYAKEKPIGSMILHMNCQTVCFESKLLQKQVVNVIDLKLKIIVAIHLEAFVCHRAHSV